MANWISDFRYAFRALTRVSAVLALVMGIGLLAGGATVDAQDWPSWRGPQDNGMARGDAPLTWSETDQRQVEGCYPRARPFLAGRLGRPDFRDDRRSDRLPDGAPAQSPVVAARQFGPPGRASVGPAQHRQEHGRGVVGADRGQSYSTRGVPPAVREFRLALPGDRRRARPLPISAPGACTAMTSTGISSGNKIWAR